AAISGRPPVAAGRPTGPWSAWSAERSALGAGPLPRRRPRPARALPPGTVAAASAAGPGGTWAGGWPAGPAAGRPAATSSRSARRPARRRWRRRRPGLRRAWAGTGVRGQRRPVYGLRRGPFGQRLWLRLRRPFAFFRRPPPALDLLQELIEVAGRPRPRRPRL